MIAGNDGRRERRGEGDWAKEESGLIVTAAAGGRVAGGVVCAQEMRRPGEQGRKRQRDICLPSPLVHLSPLLVLPLVQFLCLCLSL